MGDWDILYINDAGIANSKEQALVQGYLSGVQNVPDMFYAFNRLYLINSKRDFIYSFSPLDALQYCLYSHQQSHYLPSLVMEDAVAPPDESTPASPSSSIKGERTFLNAVNLMPEQIGVKGSDIWKEKDVSQIKDLKTLEKTFDWSFSTPYKGTVDRLSSVAKRINLEEAQLDMAIDSKFF
jgi:hypothetical protein